MLDDRELRRSGVADLEEAARRVPNLGLSQSGVLAAPQLSIRGVFSPVGAPTTGLYLDDVPFQARPLGFSGDANPHLFDVARIEVLRGPQATLFGAGSMGGTIRILSNPPDPAAEASARLSGEAALTAGGAPSHTAEVLVGLPLGGSAALRGGLYGRVRGGFVDKVDPGGGQVRNRDIDETRTVAAKAALLFRAADGLTIEPAIRYQRTEVDDLPLFESSRGPYLQSFPVAQPGSDAFLLPSLTVRAELAGVTATSVLAWFDRDHRQLSDYSTIFAELVLGPDADGARPPGGTRNRTRTRQRSLTYELKFAGGEASALGWTAGFFYQRSRLRLEQDVAEPGLGQLVAGLFGASLEDLFGPLLPGDLAYRGREAVRETQAAGFGEVAWRIAPRLELSAGARLTRSGLSLDVLSEGIYAGGGGTAAMAESRTETAFSPRIALSFRPADDLLLYASSSRGFRPGGANTPVPQAVCGADLAAAGRASAPLSYGSDALWSHELGGRITRPEAGLSIGGALFQIDWTGIQQSIFLPGCGFSFVDNLGRARNRGFELEAAARPFPGLRVTAGLGFVDARFQETLTAGGAEGLIVARGDRVPYVPRWTAVAAADYRLPLAAGLGAYLRGDLQYASGYRRTPAAPAIGHNPFVYRGDPLLQVGLRLGLEAERWEAALFVRNLLDARTITFSNADLVPASGTPQRQSALAPRTVGLTASLRF